MTAHDPQDPAPAANPLRRWQIAVGVLALLCLTLLVTSIGLRVRADAAVRERDAVTARLDGLAAEVQLQQRRAEQLLTQLSTSNERLAEITGTLRGRQLAAADRDVAAQVAAQRAAERAAGRRPAGPREQAKALRAQLRNAQTCAAGSVLALSQIHSGPDLETGSDEAARTLESVMDACMAGLD